MVGEKLGSYRIERTLGVGAMGVVYKAIHETTGRPAAVKVINGDISGRGKGFERFEREAEILQQLRHPNIVRFLSVGRYQGTSYFAMEYIPGQTLEALLVEKGPLSWEEVAAVGAQICDALHYAHEHGVVHRDLKPSNLMVTEEGRTKLTDFGIAKDLDATALTATGRTLGTAAYMAPEQIRGTPEVSHKTDLYSLGILLYQMLTGRLPFDGTTAVVLMHAHLNAPVPRASVKVTDIPRAVDDLLLQLMAKNPTDRPWDAAAVSHVLTETLAKAKKGEAVAMVWSSASKDAAPVPTPRPDRDGGRERPRDREQLVTSRKPAAERKKTATVRQRTPAAADDEPEAGLFTRGRLETAGLVLTMVAMAGFAAYALWPPSAPYLYARAEALMKSDKRTDWMTARDEYLTRLDRDHPGHPYKEAVRAWRDRLLLAEAEGRARALASPVMTKFNEPNNDSERRFVEYNTRVEAALKQKDEAHAAGVWEELAAQSPADDEGERPWHLLAKKRAAELRQSVEGRRKTVNRLMSKAQEEELAGRLNQAQALRDEVLRKYGEYPDVKDLLGPSRPAGAGL